MWKIALLLCALATGHPHHGLKRSGGEKVDAAATREVDDDDGDEAVLR